MQIKDKTFVVTGAGNGIGRELTLLLLNQGAQVAAVDLNETYLSETKTLAGKNQQYLSIHVVDITNRQDVMALPEAVLKSHDSVDGVINIAGIIQHFIKINDMDYDAIERVMNVNFWGTVQMTKAFLPYLLKRDEAHIVNVSSMGGYLPVPGQSVYGASKAAVKLFTEGLYAELLNSNVHVTLVFPGAIATNIKQNSGLVPDNSTSNQLTTPADAAKIILSGIEKNKYRVMVGSDAKIMHILCSIMPKTAIKMIHEKMRAHLPD